MSSISGSLPTQGKRFGVKGARGGKGEGREEEGKGGGQGGQGGESWEDEEEEEEEEEEWAGVGRGSVYGMKKSVLKMLRNYVKYIDGSYK